MALRWRKNGDLLCAAKHPGMPNDTYIDDKLHYRLSIEAHVIIAALDEEQSGRWYWVCDFPGIELRVVNKYA